MTVGLWDCGIMGLCDGVIIVELGGSEGRLNG